MHRDMIAVCADSHGVELLWNLQGSQCDRARDRLYTQCRLFVTKRV